MATLEDLDKRLKDLESKVASTLGALSIGPQQKGPMPGWFRAARIEGNQMLINMVDSKAGVAPRISVTDLAGVTRVEMGNLAAIANSPAQYGLRASDASGSPIFDSLGLIAVMSVLVNGGTQTAGPIAGGAGPPIGIGLAGGEVILTTATFTLTRAGTVLILALCSDFVSVAAGPFTTAHPVYFQIDGTDDATAYGFVPVYAAADAEAKTATTTILKVSTLAVGSHSVNVVWNSEEGANDTIFNSNNPLYVFQLGF